MKALFFIVVILSIIYQTAAETCCNTGIIDNTPCECRFGYSCSSHGESGFCTECPDCHIAGKNERF